MEYTIRLQTIYLDRNTGSRGNEPIWAIVNISPINWCHCLYVIGPSSRTNQTLTPQAVRFAFDLMRMTKQPGFRVMFNSLHAWVRSSLLSCFSRKENFQGSFEFQKILDKSCIVALRGRHGIEKISSLRDRVPDLIMRSGRHSRFFGTGTAES